MLKEAYCDWKRRVPPMGQKINKNEDNNFFVTLNQLSPPIYRWLATRPWAP